MDSIESIIRRIIREELRAALTEKVGKQA